MNKKEFAECINDIRLFCAEIDSLNSHIDAIAPGAICDIGNMFLDSYVDLLSRHVEDNDNWINWFVYENEFGVDKMKAGYDGKEKPIKNIDDLWALIQEGKKHDN